MHVHWFHGQKEAILAGIYVCMSENKLCQLFSLCLTETHAVYSNFNWSISAGKNTLQSIPECAKLEIM